MGCTTFNAQLITKSDMYVGRLIKKRDTGETVFLAFHHDGEKGDFVGELIHPRPATWDRPTLTFQANLPFTESGQNKTVLDRFSSVADDHSLWERAIGDVDYFAW